jgi:hypothetical protein
MKEVYSKIIGRKLAQRTFSHHKTIFYFRHMKAKVGIRYKEAFKPVVLEEYQEKYRASKNQIHRT